jgi:hypothetical protein
VNTIVNFRTVCEHVVGWSTECRVLKIVIRFCRLVGTHLGDVVSVKCVSSLNVLLGYCRLCLVCSSVRFFVIWLGVGANWPINFNMFLSVGWSQAFISFIGLWKFRTLYMIISQRWIFTSLSFGAWRRVVYFIGDFYESFVRCGTEVCSCFYCI